MKVFAKLLIALALAFAAPALAAQTVTLRTVTAAEGPVTLGDLFENAGAAAGVVVGPAVRPGGSVTLDAGAVQRTAMQSGLSWANESGLRRIVVRAGAAAPAAAAQPDGPARGIEVLTFNRSLNAGEIVQPEDLSWTEVAAAPRDAAVDADAIVGLAAKRPIRSGAVATAGAVTAPLVIKRDDIITVTFVQGGIRLELQAQAKQSAAVGETLPVENLASEKIIQAVAAGPGRAVVGPEADALRALAITDPSRLALR
jgi:flagella basal body P-ring formation protein FlgA